MALTRVHPAALLVLVAACSVPSLSLDGKQCPCSDGYVCNQATNTCVSTSDGGTTDTPGAPQCLTGAAGPTVYSFTAATTFDWQGTGGVWNGASGTITQTDTSNTESARFTTHVATGDYRVTTRMRQTGSSNMNGGIGIALRVQLASPKAHYDCEWEPRAGMLLLQKTNTGGAASTLTSVNVAGADPAATVTMEAQVTGSPAVLSCCLRELPAAKLLDVTDPDYAVGLPGLMADRMAGAFDGYTVTQP